MMPQPRIVPRFINITDPKDIGVSGKDPAVRSHVARYQWQNQFQKEESRKRKREQFFPIRIELDCSALHETSPSEENSTIPRLLGGFRVDPFLSFSVWRPFCAPLVDHYLVSMAVDIPELDSPGHRGLLRTRWFPLVISERALFLVILLLAASHYLSVHNGSSDLKLDLLRLRYEAVHAINEALGTEDHVLDDAVVGAVAKMASYEAMFGSRDNYHLHMQGLARMTALRGGLESLGLDGLLRRIVIWIDRNAAFLIGSSLYFPGATFVPGQPLPGPNPGHFLGAS
ncbi:hypothetical protein VTN77DRAFT_5751 [Rasamsonia byssochlamydoides]|uniref:uncharacterized protein n=1 Tax=Rasamsonia byssochlamydoides TaxID=89139 RepID=UPI003742D2BC